MGAHFFVTPRELQLQHRAAWSLVMMIYVSRLFFVIDTLSQMASTNGSSTNEEISGVIDGYTQRSGAPFASKKKKKKSERERGGREAWKKRKKKKERREREREMKNRTNQILTTRVRCYQNLTSFPCIQKRFRAHKVAACNLLSVLYAPR